MNSAIHSFAAGGLAVLLWLAPTGTVYPADDYLSVLEAEAEDTGRQQVGQTSSAASRTAPVKGKSARIATSMTPNLGFEGFEKELRSNYSGTHMLYMRLPGNQRRAAWKSYLDNNELRAIREHIVSMLSSG
jgi:hypothetical protein